MQCMQCMPTTHAWTRKIAGQCTHCHRTNRKTSAVSVTHRCKRSTDQEQLGCHDHPIARRSRHESKRVTVRLDQIVKEVEATLLGSQLTKGGNIGFSNLRCAHRTNCSTVASGPAQPSANAPPLRGWNLAGMEGTRQPQRGGQDSLPLQKLSDVRTGGTSKEPCTPLKARTYFIPSGSEHPGQKEGLT